MGKRKSVNEMCVKEAEELTRIISANLFMLNQSKPHIATQKNIAASAETSQSVVSKWLNGRGCPTLPQLLAIANRFHVTIGWLTTDHTKLPDRKPSDNYAEFFIRLVDFIRSSDFLVDPQSIGILDPVIVFLLNKYLELESRVKKGTLEKDEFDNWYETISLKFYHEISEYAGYGVFDSVYNKLRRNYTDADEENLYLQVIEYMDNHHDEIKSMYERAKEDYGKEQAEKEALENLPFGGDSDSNKSSSGSRYSDLYELYDL